MKRIGHLLTSAVGLSMIAMDLPAHRRPVAARAVPVTTRRRRKASRIRFNGACRISVWSGIKKRMRAARRGIPLTY